MPVEITDDMVEAAMLKLGPLFNYYNGEIDHANFVRCALSAALTQAAEQPVAWTQPSQLAILAEFEENGKHTSAEMWNKRDPNVMREFYRVNGCEDEFPDDIPLYARPPCDSRTEEREDAIWHDLTFVIADFLQLRDEALEPGEADEEERQASAEHLVVSVRSAIRALSEAGRSALKEGSGE